MIVASDLTIFEHTKERKGPEKHNAATNEPVGVCLIREIFKDRHGRLVAAVDWTSIRNNGMRTTREHRSCQESGMNDDFGKKTWTPQQIPAGVSGTPPKPDKEPSAEPPKQPDKK